MLDKSDKPLKYFSKKVKLISVAFLFPLTLSGCVGLIDMHPRAAEITDFSYQRGEPIFDNHGNEMRNSEGEVLFQNKFQGDLSFAIDAANAQRNLYVDAGNNQSMVRNVGAVALTGLSAAALYTGITSTGSRNAITAMGIAGAGLLGLDGYFISKPLQSFYYKASQTIGCAVMAMRPNLVTKLNYDNFISDTYDLSQSLSVLQSEIISIDPLLLPINTSDPIIQVAEAEVNATKKVEQQGKLILAKGDTALNAINNAGTTLRLHVRDIMDSVDIEITKNEPSLDSLVAILGGLGGPAGQLVPFVDFTAKSSKSDDSASGSKLVAQSESLVKSIHLKNLEDGINRLRAIRKTSLGKIAEVERFVNHREVLAEKVGDIASCQVPTVDIRFSVTPNVDEINVNSGSTILFAITNETGIPAASFAGLQPADSTVKVELKNGAYSAVVFISEATKTSEVLLVIHDGTNQAKKTIKLKITGKDEGGTGTTIKPPVITKPPSPPIKDSKQLTNLQIMEMQAYFKNKVGGSKVLKVDGILGKETRLEIEQFKKTENSIKENNKQVTAELWVALLKNISPTTPVNPSDLLGKKTDAENLMDKAEYIKGLQRNLKTVGFTSVTESGIFDIKTREGILELQKTHDLPLTGTLSSQPLIDELIQCKKSSCGK